MPVSGICVLAVSFASAIVAALSGATAESRAPALAVHAEGAALARHPSQDSAPATRSTILGAAKVLSASDARALGVGGFVGDASAPNLSDRATSWRAGRGERLTVVAFTSATCPLCRKFAPALARLEE